MAQPVFYQTMNNVGIDPTLYYNWTASVTPETPAPPFLVGTQAIGSDGSQFVFVQASTSISLTDFVMISMYSAPYTANSLTTTNVQSSYGYGIGSSGLVVKGSVSYIPAGAYFWALTRGQNVPGYTSNTGASPSQPGANNPPVILFTTTTAGTVISLTVSQSTAVALQGIVCINSLTITIQPSIVPPAGNALTNGYILGPVFNLNNPRTIIVAVSPSLTGTSLPVGSF